MRHMEVPALNGPASPQVNMYRPAMTNDVTANPEGTVQSNAGAQGSMAGPAPLIVSAAALGLAAALLAFVVFVLVLG
jgi:hypothetical protein